MVHSAPVSSLNQESQYNALKYHQVMLNPQLTSSRAGGLKGLARIKGYDVVI